jgi:hypothetical protein
MDVVDEVALWVVFLRHLEAVSWHAEHRDEYLKQSFFRIESESE